MRDDAMKELFGRVQAGPPPLGFDVGSVVARGHRVRARRRVAAVGGGSLAAVSAVLLASFWLGHRPGPEPVVPATRPPAPANHAPASPHAWVTPRTEPSCSVTAPPTGDRCATRSPG